MTSTLFSGSPLDSKTGFRAVADTPRLLSVLLHVTLVTLALIPWASAPKRLPVPVINLALYAPAPLTLPAEKSGGGGGGGRHQLTPPSLGKLPRAADKQIVPPDPEPPRNPDPTLIAETTIVAPQLASLPQLNLLSIGDPNGIAGPPSPGSGNGFGIGTGDGHGIGEGKGPGVGPGEGGGTGGDIFQVTGGVTAPVPLNMPPPEYSEEARLAHFQGTVSLDTVIHEDGSVEVLRVARGVGFGLDQKAINAVLTWRFKPGRKNGKAVATYLNVQVNFNLR